MTAEAAAPAPIDWTVRWETELSPAELDELATVLRRIFPRDPRYFGEGRPWAGGRPELRLVGRIDGRIVAHLGITRRFLRVPANGAGILVGDVGMVGIDPDFRGTGLGVRLLDRAADELAALAVAFGVLNTGDSLERFYRSGGWLRAEDTEFHSIGLDHQTEVWAEAVLYLPVTAAASDWPSGVVQRNGQET